MYQTIFDKSVLPLPQYEGFELDAAFLGGKGYGLWRMKQLGVNVPPAIIFPTEVCRQYMANPEAVMTALSDQISAVRKYFKGHFGYEPLLSVRSGARVSMPGMMDTILNVGIDDLSEDEWKTRIGAPALQDCYRRLITMYGNVVKGIDRHLLEGAGTLEDALGIYANHTGFEFPDTDDQILGAIEAVFKSWNNERAKFYRKMNNIPDEWGTAVVVQAMVFGNMNDNSCTGVLFTRNPDNGSPDILGEYLVNAQGEDVVAGIRTPEPLSSMQAWNPDLYKELVDTVVSLEKANRDVQDVEFTVQDGKLYILQTRNAKRSARAAVKIALDMVDEGVLEPKDALSRLSFKELDLASLPEVDPAYKVEPFAVGIPACAGVVTGKVVLSAKAAIDCKEPCILVTEETTPDDIAGMDAAVGVLTMTGGATSHAAVVARSMNKPCVVGLSKAISSFTTPDSDTVLSIDGASGRVWLGTVPVIAGDTTTLDRIYALCAGLPEMSGVRYVARSKGSKSACTVLPLYSRLHEEVSVLVAEVVEALDTAERVVLDLCGRNEIEECFSQTFLTLDADGNPTAITTLLNELSAWHHRLEALLPPGFTVGTHAKHLKVIPSVNDLQALLSVEEGSKIVWTGTPTKASERALKWLTSEGCATVSFGVMGAGESYLSPQQAIAPLLKA